MLTIKKNWPTPVSSAKRCDALETVLFGFPLGPATQCGGCARFAPLDRKCQVSGRCKLGIKPGIINRTAAGCGIYRARGTPATFQDRAVRP